MRSALDEWLRPRGWREGFTSSRLAAGALGLAALPPYFAWRGAPSTADAVLVLCLALPVLAACLSFSGHRVGVATFVSGLADAALASWIALGFGVLAFGPAPFPAPGPGPAIFGLAIFSAGLLCRLPLVGSSLFGRRGPATATLQGGDPTHLLEAVCDLVTWHDRNGDVIEAGPGAQTLLGASPRSLCGGGLLARVHVTDRPAYLKALSDAANGHGPTRAEIRLHAGPRFGDVPSDPGFEPGDRVIWADVRIQALPEAGESRLVAAIRDISPLHRQAEDAEVARRQAERADSVKGRFLATVSHELRTPLNAIIGFSELLAVDHPYVLTEERRKDYAVIIRNSGHHLLEIVNTLLDMSKIESGNFNFSPEPFGFRDLAASCCDLMQLKADQAGITLARKIDADLPEIVADRRACRQILINLLSNAVKFTPAGGLVTVALSRRAEQLVLAVSDTGIGIPEEDLPRLGDPFFQSGEVHRRTYEGTGLGLSVVRGLVGLHGGTLKIESGTGVGTTVSVSLPLRAGEGAAATTPVPVTARRLGTPGDERMSA